MIKLLLVEDDEAITAGLEYSLSQEGFKVVTCHNAASAFDKIQSQDFDFAIIDISLPDGNGFDICKRLKEKGDVPVIFLTARDDEGSVVMGLDIGADDYITKPFRLRELHSRIRAVLRRVNKSTEDRIIRIGSLAVNPAEGKVRKNGNEVFLTALETAFCSPLLPTGDGCSPGSSCFKVSGMFLATSSMIIPSRSTSSA